MWLTQMLLLLSLLLLELQLLLVACCKFVPLRIRSSCCNPVQSSIYQLGYYRKRPQPDRKCIGSRKHPNLLSLLSIGCKSYLQDMVCRSQHPLLSCTATLPHIEQRHWVPESRAEQRTSSTSQT